MITRIIVPQLDANTIDVTVTAWRKAPGDRVQAGELIADLTTDKATFELEASGSGVLLAILAATKSVVPSGYILAILGEPGETDAAAVAANQTLMAAYGQGRAPASSSASPLPATPSPARIRATPRARRLAQEHGLDLARIQSETGAAVIDEAVLKPYLDRL